MNAQELFEELGKLTVLELEQRLKQLHGEVAATKALLSIAKARQKAKRKSGKTVERAVVSGNGSRVSDG